MKYLFLGQQTVNPIVHSLSSVSHITSLSEVLDGPACFILNIDHPDEQDQLLIQLRMHPRWFMFPVFILQSSPLSAYLCDGLLQDDLLLRIEQFEQRYQLLKLDPEKGLTERLLSYLWLWPGRTLMAKAYPESPRLYDYPLAALWTDQDNELFAWLYSMERDGLIEGAELVDRVRYCSSCHSGHLNYVETCPECGSIDVGTESALHCFACGHVAAQSDFLHGGHLSCPNCLSQLRHIGVDYDRPLENYRCHSCHSLFVDGVVKVRCLENRHEQSPEQLIMRTIRHYQLTDAGVMFIRNGALRNLIPEWIGGNVAKEHFYWLLLWQNKLALRHKVFHLVVALKFINLAQAIYHLGEAEAITRIDALTQRLQSVLRLTDVCCHYRDDILLFFLPNTPANQIEVITRKLANLGAEQSSHQLHLDFRLQPLPDATLDDNAALWIEQLLGAFAS